MPNGPLPDVPNVVALKFGGLLNGIPFLNVLHASHDASTPNVTDLGTLATNLSSWWLTNIVPICNTGTVMNSMTVLDISSRTGLAAVSNTARTGTLTNPCTNNVSYAISWLIARRYRGGHPRTYMAGLSTQQLNGTQQLLGTARTSILTGWTTLLAALSGYSLASMPNLRLCNVSYYHGKNPDGTPALRPTPVVDLIVGTKGDLRIDSQRHRLGRPV